MVSSFLPPPTPAIPTPAAASAVVRSVLPKGTPGVRVPPDRGMDSPFTGKFKFSVDGVEIGMFMEVSGLSVQMKTEDVMEGGVNSHVHRLPGRLTWPNIVLKRGITDSDGLFGWLYQTTQQSFQSDKVRSDKAAMQRPSGAIEMIDSRGALIRSWEFVDALAVKWTGPKFAASSSDVASEELEIAHNGFKSIEGSKEAAG